MLDHDRMTSMITGYWVSQIVHAAAMFSFADHLAEGPLTAEQIASRERLDPVATLRLLRACVAIDLAADGGDGTFADTPLLQTLRKNRSGSLHGMAAVLPSHSIWSVWGRLCESVKSGHAQAEVTLGKPMWEYLADHPQEAERVSGSMIPADGAASAEVAAIVAPRDGDIVADIGGASGSLLHAVLKTNSTLRGIVFDLANVIPHAIRAAHAAGLESRIETIGGDFRREVPRADILLLRYILHDWDDDTCVGILRNCRRALKPGGRVMIIERLIEPAQIKASVALMDLNMMVSLGGREREKQEFDALLRTAGLHCTKVSPTSGDAALLEAIAD